MCVLDLSYLARIHSQSNLIFTTIPRGRIIILILRGSEKKSTELISGGTWCHPQPLVSNTLHLTQLSRQCSEKAVSSSLPQKLASYVVKSQFAGRTPWGDHTFLHLNVSPDHAFCRSRGIVRVVNAIKNGNDLNVQQQWIG